MQNYRIWSAGGSVAIIGAVLAACAPFGPTPESASSDVGGATGVVPIVSGGGGDSGAVTIMPGGGGDAGAGLAPGQPVVTGTAGTSGSSCMNNVAGTAGSTRPTPSQISGPLFPAVVTTAARSVPPISGGTLLITVDGTKAIASDPDRDQVYIVDLANKSIRTVVLLAGDEPGRIAEDGVGRIHVALRRGGAVVTIDPQTATVSARRPACSAPRGLAYQAAGDLVQVACAGGELVSLPAAGGRPERALVLDRDLRDVVVGPNGGLLVSTFRKAEVLVVGAEGKVSSRLQPGSGMVMSALTLTPQNRTPSVAWRMLSLDDTTGSVVMLHQTGDTDAIDIDPVVGAGAYGGGPLGSNAPGCNESVVQPGVSVLTPDQCPPPVAMGIQNGSLTVDLALSPDHSTIALALTGNGESPWMPSLVTAPLSSFEGGETPSSNPCGVSASTAAKPVGQVIAVSYSPSGVLYAQTREPETLWAGDGSAPISLASDMRADTGHLIFHANAGSGVACASCHPEGGDDGRVWNFACTGARRTQSIRGDIGPTAPFHWDGSEPDFSHLTDDVFTGRMAGPTLDAEEKNALANWVNSIPALPRTAGLNGAAVARGAVLFNDPTIACASCHGGSLLTNNMTIDVGTGQAFQVPSLRGVSWRAPFMHDGCAATLTDRFGDPACTGGDKHGVTSMLTPSQITDLTTYLESL
jgi:mono/diheme cytochrome c family protein